MSAWTAVIPNSCGMFLIVMQWISHCVQWQIDSVGVFVWAPAPFCGFCFVSAVCFAVSAGETQVWLGDLRVVVFGWLLFFFVCCFNRFAASMDLICPCTNVFLTAYAHVRTEPQSDIGQTRGKKTSFGASFCELRHSGFSPLCPWQILVVVVFVGPCPVRFLLCFSAGWRSAYLAGGSAFRPLWFVFCLCF